MVVINKNYLINLLLKVVCLGLWGSCFSFAASPGFDLDAGFRPPVGMVIPPSGKLSVPFKGEGELKYDEDRHMYYYPLSKDAEFLKECARAQEPILSILHVYVKGQDIISNDLPSPESRIFKIDLSDVGKHLANTKSLEYGKIRKFLLGGDLINLYSLFIPKEGLQFLQDIFSSKGARKHLYPSLVRLRFGGDMEKKILDLLVSHFSQYDGFVRDRVLHPVMISAEMSIEARNLKTKFLSGSEKEEYCILARVGAKQFKGGLSINLRGLE